MAPDEVVIRYEGPTDSEDPTTVLEIAGDRKGERTKLPLGQDVPVSREVAKAAQDVEGHKVVTVPKSKQGDGSGGGE